MKEQQSANKQENTMEQIVQLARQGDETSFSYIVLAYTGAIRHIARSMDFSSVEYEDIVQEGTIGLMNAVRTFKEDKQNSFYTYATTCIKNNILNALKKSSTQKNASNKFSVSFDEESFEQEQQQFLNSSLDPEQQLIVRENIDAIHSKIQQDLSDLEKEVLFLYLGGFSYSEIANSTQTTEKSVDNALQRVRKKLVHFQK